MRTAIRGTGLVLLALFLSAGLAMAAELNVVCVGALANGMKAVAADFTKETGTQVNIGLTNPTLVNQAVAGGKAIDSLNKDKPVDLLVAAVPSMEEFDKKGALKAGSRTTVLKVGIGVSIKQSAAKPDLSTPDAFKKAIVGAKAVTFGDPTQANGSGIIVQAVLTKAGVWDQAKAKGKIEGLGAARELVAKGQADLGLFNASEAAAPGVVLAAEVPQALQAYTVYAAAITAKAPSGDLAQRFLAFLAKDKEAWAKAHVEMAAK